MTCAAWSPDAAHAQVLDDDPTVGFDFRRARYTGAGLIALRDGGPISAEHLPEAKRLLRAALKRVLGDRELESVRAIREVRRLTQANRQA